MARCDTLDVMTGTWRLRGIEGLPMYLIGGHPQSFGSVARSQDDFIVGTPLVVLLNRLQQGEYLYLVDLTGEPAGTVKLTLLSPDDPDPV